MLSDHEKSLCTGDVFWDLAAYSSLVARATCSRMTLCGMLGSSVMMGPFTVGSW